MFSAFTAVVSSSVTTTSAVPAPGASVCAEAVLSSTDPVCAQETAEINITRSSNKEVKRTIAIFIFSILYLISV
jgi:hypothetical protein